MTIYELRTYTAIPGRMPALLSRFEHQTLQIWERLGIKQLGFWTTLVGPNNNELTYILIWNSLAEREEKIAKFTTDAEWARVKEATEKEAGGPLTEKIANSFLSPTSFSKLQ